MDKILFVVPPHITFQQFVNPAHNERIVHKKYGDFGSVLTEMPLGVLSLSAYVKKYAAVETKLIDFNIALNKLERFEFHSFLEFFTDFLSSSAWKEYAPSIIGVSTLFTSACRNMLDIAQCCRDIFTNAIIIGGGSVVPRFLFVT